MLGKVVLILSMILLCGVAPDERFKFKCEDYCEIQADGSGIVVNGVCGCWKPVDIGKPIIFVGRGAGEFIKDKKKPYSNE